ncbi:MAG: substrate-binding domain-containing protein [Lachnospiraceae bacterium]|nr:substrate-binding domain-containing protein [Lachnospiraceae bacterium]
MSKRILMLSSTWDSEYSKAVIAGILERIGDDDMELHIFNAYDDLLEIDYLIKGREIYSLPNPKWYDGLLIAFTTVESEKLVKDITSKFHEYNKPIVGIDTHAENAIFCGLDNYRSMYQLVEHMITIHDCRTLNYLGGPEYHNENAERYRAFCDCLTAHGIRVENKRVLHKRFRKRNGAEAYKEWKERGVNMADAVICANDFMALGYTEAAANDGLAVPDYTKVTGFDNIDEAQNYSPSITSVNRNWKALGYESMDALLEALDNNTEFDTRFVEGSVAFNESCGCELSRDIRSDYNKNIRKNKEQMEGLMKHGYIRQMLLNSRSIDEFMENITKCDEKFDIGDVAISLNRSFFDGDPDMKKVGYDTEMTLISDQGREDIDHNERLYPDGWRQKSNAFLFSSLRNNEQTYGYAVMPYNSDFFTRAKHRIFIESLSIGLDKLNNRIAIKGSI